MQYHVQVPGNHTLLKGENLVAISEKEGFWAETIWNRAENSQLRQKRQFLNILAAGDILFIPEKEPKTLGCSTDRRHRFRRKGIPAMFRLRLLADDEPLANKKYILVVDRTEYSGVTDAQGRLHHHLPAGSTSGQLLLEGSISIDLEFATLDPVEEITGAQNRLMNLGFYSGPADGEWNDATRLATRLLQAHFKLDETGELDDKTRAHLRKLHDESSEELKPEPAHG